MITYNKQDKSLLLAASASALAVAAILSYRTQTKKRNKLERSWSFTSEGMRIGHLPPECKAPPTIINAALYFDTPNLPTEEALAEQVMLPLLSYERFSKVPTDYGMKHGTYKTMDLVRTVDFSGGEEELHAAIYKILPDPLSPEKPLWELVRVVNQNQSARSVVLLRVHHCLGDGLSLINAFDQVLTTDDGSPSESKVTRALMKRQYKMPPITEILSAVWHVLTLGASPHDDNLAIYQKDLTYSGNRKVLLLPQVPLDYIKHCKHGAPLPATVNDIMTCAISQAVHDYCRMEDPTLFQEKGDQVQCRALLPVSLPRSSSAPPLQNRFCMVSADLSVGYSNLLDRLQAIHQTTTFLKQSPRALVQLWIQNHVASKLPRSVARQTAHDIFSRHSLVLTNVPGPEHFCRLAGGIVNGLQLFFENVIPQVDLITYAGTVYGNVVYDPNHWTNGERMAALYAKALVDLGQAFGVADIPQDLVELANTIRKELEK